MEPEQEESKKGEDQKKEEHQERMASRRQIRCDDWFSRIVGCREIEWRQQTNKLISQHSDGSLFITNCTNQKKKFNAGRFSVLRLEDLRREVETSSPSKPALCPLEIITCLDGVSMTCTGHVMFPFWGSPCTMMLGLAPTEFHT